MSIPEIWCSDAPSSEEYLLKVLLRASDLSLFSRELAHSIRDWPTFYHLSPVRSNLLRPVIHLLGGRVLEAGAGCGALTRYLGEQGRDVLALEGSPRRAAILAQRCLDLPNVRVYCDNLFEFSAPAEFNAIVCVGVLEYGGLHTGANAALESALSHLRSLLAGDGVLVVAIENQLGLKYLAGAPEDHLGSPHYGISDLYKQGEPKTWGRQQWERSLEASGFPQYRFLYPFPDYKAPALILDSAALAEPRLNLSSIIRNHAVSRLSFAYKGSFAEEMAWPAIATNGLIGQLANSFLIVASPARRLDDSVTKGKLLWKYATDRLPEFCKELVVERTPEAVLKVCTRGVNPHLPEPTLKYRHRICDDNFVVGDGYCDALYSIVNRPGWTLEQVRDWAWRWLCFLDDHLQGEGCDLLPEDFIDCIPRNLIVDAAGAVIPIDLEYIADAPVSADYVRIRGLIQTFSDLGLCAPPAAGVSANLFDIAKRVLRLSGHPLPEDRALACLAEEAHFIEAIRGIPAAQTEGTLLTSTLEFRPAPFAASARPFQLSQERFRFQVYWRDSQRPYWEENSVYAWGVCGERAACVTLQLPQMDAHENISFRLDLSDKPGLMYLRDLRFLDALGNCVWEWDGRPETLKALHRHQMEFFETPANDPGALLVFEGDDPWFELSPGRAVLEQLEKGASIRVSYYALSPLLFTIDAATEIRKQASERSDSMAAQISDLSAELAIFSGKLTALREQIESMNAASSQRATQLEILKEREKINHTQLAGRVDKLSGETTRHSHELKQLLLSLDHANRVADAAFQKVQQILESRIWRLLCALGKPILRARAWIDNPLASFRAAARKAAQLIPGRPETAYLICDEPALDDSTPRSGTVRLRGWAASSSGIRRVEVRVGDEGFRSAEMGGERPDVTSCFPGLRDASHSGWSLEVETLRLPSGRYPIVIRAETGKGTILEKRDSIIIDHDRGFASDYERWIAQCERPQNEAILRNPPSFERQPLISVVMPVYKPALAELERAINSVRSQSYANWELCIADDASGSPEIEKLLKKHAGTDPRIELVFRERNGGIVAASNSALELAGGEFVALLDHDDEYAPHALLHVVDAILREPEGDMFYSDEDKIDLKGRRYDPFFKPDWSPDLLLSQNYICHLLVIRRSVLDQVGQFRSECEGSQDYDLVLRVSEVARKISHIPKVLYHWRSVPGSTAHTTASKEYAFQGARRALEAHLARTGLAATVAAGRERGRWRVRFTAPDEPRVSIIIASGGNVDILQTNLNSILSKTIYRNYELILVDNSRAKSVERLANRWKKKHPLQYIDFRNQPFNYSTINNHAAARCSSPLLLFLNDDTSVIAPDWLTAMVEHACRKEVGVVGAKLLYPDGRIQHAGVVMGIYNNCGHAFKGLDGRRTHYFGLSDVIRNVSAVTGACLMTRREVFQEAGGFDEQNFSVAFNDIDLCLRIGSRGYRIIYTPHALLYHHEAFSKMGRDLIPHWAEVEEMRRRWRSVIAVDPYYNPNLSIAAEDFSPRSCPDLDLTAAL